jgi:hypothetical protein
MNEQVNEGQSTEPAKATRQAETVTMEDGRQVEFVGKRKLLKDSIFNEDGTVNHIRLDFRNGKTIKFHIPHSLLGKFAAHGAEQKLGDETAGTEDVDDMYEDVLKLTERLHNGEWATKREPGVSGISLLIRAVAELKGQPVEKVRDFLSTKSAAEKQALGNHPKVKPIIERLQQEKLAKVAHVNTEDLLGQLDAA